MDIQIFEAERHPKVASSRIDLKGKYCVVDQ